MTESGTHGSPATGRVTNDRWPLSTGPGGAGRRSAGSGYDSTRIGLCLLAVVGLVLLLTNAGWLVAAGAVVAAVALAGLAWTAVDRRRTRTARDREPGRAP
ncbi:hypothetical protein BJY24_004290 [Nocardia transvalensis]|uniref:Uncharacterized protein n=1 Tax=Nocardia transvalensis TaxID=37333 RepID=A0A7W9UJE7_9NOCA|nr:hypothetical protein [Nocardia transvalensis]MBB5915378.1 hypothetical protein [Nocardia transvalensis]